MQTFSGRHVVITGASRGLGLEFARAFSRSGAAVHLLARDAASLSAAVASLQEGAADSPRANAYPCDVTRSADVARVFAELPACDVLINNAGANRPQSFFDVDEATLDWLIALNVRSMFVVAQQAASAMRDAGRGGAIVNISSQMGHVGAPNRTVYCTTKHAIEGLTKAMAVELAPLGIRVNSVAPTYVETPMTRPFLENPEFRADTLRRIPLGRIGTTDEVAAAVLFLASDAASLITGTSLLVDGGYTAQ